MAIDRFKASLYDRLKCRSDAGPTLRRELNFSRTVVIRCLPLGSIRGSFSSSARISASSSSDRSTSIRCCPAWSPPWPLPVPGLGLPPTTSPSLPSPAPTPPPLSPYRKCGQLHAPDGDADQVLTLLPDQLALGEELPQVVADATLDDLAEPLVVLLDLEDHALTVRRRRELATDQHSCTRVRAERRLFIRVHLCSFVAKPVFNRPAWCRRGRRCWRRSSARRWRWSRCSRSI